MTTTARQVKRRPRAVLGGDREGITAILRNTECVSCLAIETAIIGIMMTGALSDDPDIFTHEPGSPWPSVHPSKRVEHEINLAGLSDPMPGERGHKQELTNTSEQNKHLSGIPRLTKIESR